MGASLAQLGEGSSKFCKLGHLGPKPVPSQGTGTGAHWGPGTCWAEGQAKLPLLKLHWAHPPQPTCPFSHRLPQSQAAPRFPAALSLLGLGGGSEGRPQPEKEASPTLGTLPWVGGVSEYSCPVRLSLQGWGPTGSGGRGGADAGSSRLPRVHRGGEEEWVGSALTCEPEAEALAAGAPGHAGPGGAGPALRAWPGQSGRLAESP